ncbi:MAG: succinate--CoA ligase subunit beta [Phycisphaerae bacterium]|nr:succinate--CoA ligase subunit beta [Phycisphaerae bacterium]
MLLMEYLARDLLAEKNIPIPRGRVVSPGETPDLSDVRFPAVVKAQVPTGGRGKAGGILPVMNAKEAKAVIQNILGMTIKGFPVERALVVEKINGKRELYLAILLDRGRKCPTVIFSASGGVEIEEIARTKPDSVIRAEIEPTVGVREYHTRYLLDRAGLEETCFFQFHEILENLYRVFWDRDCLLAEINPLMIDEEGNLIAVDAKINVDDSAMTIHHSDLLELRDSLERDERVLEARKNKFLFIPVAAEGRITIMSNGSGMLMASMDALQQRGLPARSVLDLGGGATADRIAKGIGILMEQPGVEGLFANIFGGITRCDEIAAGVKTAAESLRDGQFIVLRLEGTNKPQGREILQSVSRNNVVLVEKLSEAAGVFAERMGAV